MNSEHLDIQPSDVVQVIMSRPDIFPWQQGKSHAFQAVFLRGPEGDGDALLQFLVPLSGGPQPNGAIIEINGNHAWFVGMLRKVDGDSDRGDGGSGTPAVVTPDPIVPPDWMTV